MSTQVGWSEIALRLLLTIAAGALIGINREENGRPAGLRTVLLVSLAACISMIQVNLLLPIRGKASDSFVVMDLMRLPLGILSGMGFIGAGAILKKGNLVLGVTTAATLWFATGLGLCFGGGQLVLGSVATVLGLAVLWTLKPVERLFKQERQAHLSLVMEDLGATDAQVTAAVRAAGFRVDSLSVVYDQGSSIREVRCVVKWHGKFGDVQPPAFVEELAHRPKTLKVAWTT